MGLSRRHVLQVLAAAPALSACGGDANLPDPYAAWRDPGAAEADPRRFALAHAILAPNPHNTQAWAVTLDDADGMTFYCDLERRLPFTDPLDRQITLGCGCFLELYRIALAARGYAPEIIAFPDGEPLPRLDERAVARVRIGPQIGRPSDDPWARAITARRTNRNAYDPARPPAEDALKALADAVTNTGEEYSGELRWETTPARVAQIRDLVWRAFDREMRTQGAAEETFNWLRFGREEIARHRDGLAIEGPLIPALKAVGMFSRENMINPDSAANQQAVDDWSAKAESAPAFAWLTSRNDSPTSRLLAGRAYARMALAAVGQNLAIHPWSQALQEYAAMADLYAEAREMLDMGDATLQMLVRLGYAEPAGPSARRGVDPILRA